VKDSVARIHRLIGNLRPFDALEVQHRSETLAWLENTDDVFRRVKPSTPPRHLVSYIVPFDPRHGSYLLVDHIDAGLWLPPGGHIDPDEHPAETARREMREELGVDAVFAEIDGRGEPKPTLLTVTPTVGASQGHDDVSLWFRVKLSRSTPLVIDRVEFREARWWSEPDIRAADSSSFDPHFTRFLTKASVNSRP